MERILKEKDKHGKDIIVCMTYVYHNVLKIENNFKIFFRKYALFQMSNNCILLLKHINFTDS